MLKNGRSQYSTLHAQACELRKHYPDLYRHLVARDMKIRRAMRRIPSPADIELSATYNHSRHVATLLEAAGPGLDELGSEAISQIGLDPLL